MKKDISQNQGTIINLITGIVTMIVQLAVNFVLSPFIVQNLGEEANGFTQLANNFVSYASLITLAFNSMAGRFISVQYYQKNLRKANQYYNSVIVCNVCIILIFIPVCTYIIADLPSFISMGNSDVLDVKLLFSCVFVNYMLSLILSLFNMSMFVMNKLYIQNIINLIRNVLNAVLLLCVFSIFSPKMYFVSAISMILTLISIPLTFIIQRKILPEIKFQFSYFRIKSVYELIKSGIWNTVNQCGNMLMTGLDLLMANVFIDAVSMGVLSVAKTIPNAVVTLAGVLNTSYAPELTINWAQGDKDNTMKNLWYSMKISSIIISIPVVVFCVFSVHFYQLWQPMLEAKRLAVLSVLSMMALIPFSGTQVLNNVFSATNKLKLNSLTFIFAGVLNVVIVYILLKNTQLGVFAVAGVSPLITMIRTMFFVLPYTATLLHQKWYSFYKYVFISSLIAFVNFVVSVAILYIIDPTTWIMLILAVAFATGLAFIVDLLVVLSKNERLALIKKIVRKIK